MNLAFLLALSTALAADDAPLIGALAGGGATPLAEAETRANGTLQPWGQLQTWATLWDQDVDPQADPYSYGDPEADPGFTLARARLGLDGFLPLGDTLGARAQVEYALSVGVASPYDALGEENEDVQLVDAFTRYTTPLGKHPFSIAIGAQRVPFDRESLISSATLLFQERAVHTNWMMPGREVGVVVGQQLKWTDSGPSALIRLGAFNGNGQFYRDTDPGNMLSARVEFTHGQTYQTWDPEKKTAIGVGLGAINNNRLATNRTSLGADLLTRVSIVTLLGGLTTRTTEPTDATVVAPSVAVKTKELGYFGQLSLWLPVDDEHGVELGTRYGTYDDATQFDDNGDVAILHSGLTWRNPLPFVDLGIGFIHRGERAGTALANDTVRLWTQIRPAASKTR